MVVCMPLKSYIIYKAIIDWNPVVRRERLTPKVLDMFNLPL